MKQLSVSGHDDFNFYSWTVYIDQLNEYGEKRFDDNGRLIIQLAELVALVSEAINIPADRFSIDKIEL